MQSPRVEGLKIIELVGNGPCGNVYLAEDESGTRLAVKLYQGLSVNRQLLARSAARMEEGGWPKGAIPWISADFDARPAVVVMPWVADLEGEGKIRPRSLQYRLDEFPGDHSWSRVRELAAGLAELHELRVAHANLKPGNVFFDDLDRLIVTDWALGNVAGVSHPDYTDAYLYQPPEQLRDPEGYLEEAGYRWDVFSFGVLAYRLLTGMFPRCDETFSKVAPACGETCKEGIHADVLKIARNLENQQEITWPDEAANAVEAGYREWIERCLKLDPRQRPATMSEVARGLEQVEVHQKAEALQALLLDQRRHADRRSFRAWMVAGTLTAVALLLGSLWQFSQHRLRSDRVKVEDEISLLKAQAENAIRAREVAQESEIRSRKELEYERDVGRSRLEASRAIGDHLFEWAMEKGHRRLPPLDGRELRLVRLERYYKEFIRSNESIPTLNEECSRARLMLAEISLARGESTDAAERLEVALREWKKLPTDSSWKLRVATDRLLLALLLQSKQAKELPEAFQAARKDLQAVPRDEVDQDRLEQLLAILDFHEAQWLAENRQDAKALEQLMRATQSLNRLADQRPDVAVLRSELANCYLSTATILEGIGSLGDAREVRGLAAAQLVKLLKDNPREVNLRLDLAGCYGAMAEAALLSGDAASADDLSNQATILLEGVLREQPEHAEAVSRLGAQRWIRAGLLRDRGKTADALKMAEDGIRMLEGAHASSPANGTVSYRLALLWWQKGRMVGAAGDRDQELLLLNQARELLVRLDEKSEYGLSSAYPVSKSLGYLLGDLGHSQTLTKRNDEAKATFAQAVAIWEKLLKAQPQSEEAEEALAWCRQRLKEIP